MEKKSCDNEQNKIGKYNDDVRRNILGIYNERTLGKVNEDDERNRKRKYNDDVRRTILEINNDHTGWA